MNKAGLDLLNKQGFYAAIKKQIFNKVCRYCKKNDITKVELAELAFEKFMQENPKLEYDTNSVKL